MKCSRGISNFLDEISSPSILFLFKYCIGFAIHQHESGTGVHVFPITSHLPPHTIPLGHPSAPAPSILYHASNLYWRFISHMIIYMFSALPFTSLLSTAICKASSDNHFAFLHLFFLGLVLITTTCTMLQTSIHSSSGTLSDLIPWIYLSFPLYICKGFDLGHNWMAWWFSLLSSISVWFQQ